MLYFVAFTIFPTEKFAKKVRKKRGKTILNKKLFQNILSHFSDT